MRILGVLLAAAALLVGLGGGYWLYTLAIKNPGVEREILENPHGERAEKVMLLTLPSGRRLPVNYLREGAWVYAGADGSWWKELRGEGVAVTLLVRGETLRGTARAILDDPARTRDVFARLRPNAIEGFGTLVAVRIATAGDAVPGE